MNEKMFWPSNAETIEVENATVPFVHFMEEDTHYFGFDTSECVPPEPMVNAMVALEKLTNAHTKVIMINHRSPAGLLAKVEPFYAIEATEIGEGKVKLVFSYKKGESEKADLSKKSCAG